MARVANTKRNIVIKSMAEVENRIHSANNKLREELDPENKLNTTYKDGLDQGAKDDLKEAVQIFRWLIEDEFSLTPPAAFTDTDIDNLDLDIRTHEEG